MLTIWLWALRAWERDESEDLSGTMATVDTALQRADQIASWLQGVRTAPPPPAPAPSSGAGELDPAHPPPTGGLLPDALLPDALPSDALPPDTLPPEALPPNDNAPFDEPIG